jgi:hypothetical protein
VQSHSNAATEKPATDKSGECGGQFVINCYCCQNNSVGTITTISTEAMYLSCWNSQCQSLTPNCEIGDTVNAQYTSAFTALVKNSDPALPS